jgi:hypothetical protein
MNLGRVRQALENANIDDDTIQGILAELRQPSEDEGGSEDSEVENKVKARLEEYGLLTAERGEPSASASGGSSYVEASKKFAAGEIGIEEYAEARKRAKERGEINL